MVESDSLNEKRNKLLIIIDFMQAEEEPEKELDLQAIRSDHRITADQISAIEISLDRTEHIEQFILELHQTRNIFDLQLRHQSRQIIENYALCSICCNYKYNVVKFCCSQHQYCKSCIVGIIRENLNSSTPIRCPEEDCLAQFSQNSPYYSNLSDSDKTLLKKINRNREALANPEVKICKKEDCDGILKANKTKIECEICKQLHCTKCLSLSHPGRCDNQNAKIYEKKYRFRRCPNCKMVVEKNRGCDHITCHCSYEFCYICGRPFASGHSCFFDQNRGCLTVMRDELYRQNSPYNSCINCLKTLQLLEPSLDRNYLIRYLIILFVTLTVYPAVNAVILSIAILSLVVYLVINVAVLAVYSVCLPIFQIKNLQLPLSVWLLNRNVPSWLVRILMVPLYPVNLMLAIKGIPSLCDRLQSQNWTMVFKTVQFFLLLPCLMIKNEPQDEE